MKLYKFGGIYCNWRCGNAIVIAESRQDAMEMIVRDDAAPGEEDAAVKLFREWQAKVSDSGFEASRLWSTILTEDPDVYSLDEPVMFKFEGETY